MGVNVGILNTNLIYLYELWSYSLLMNIMNGDGCSYVIVLSCCTFVRSLIMHLFCLLKSEAHCAKREF